MVIYLCWLSKFIQLIYLVFLMEWQGWIVALYGLQWDTGVYYALSLPCYRLLQLCTVVLYPIATGEYIKGGLSQRYHRYWVYMALLITLPFSRWLATILCVVWCVVVVCCLMCHGGGCCCHLVMLWWFYCGGGSGDMAMLVAVGWHGDGDVAMCCC